MKTELQSNTLDYALDYSLAVSLAGVFLVPFLRDAFGFPYAAWYVFGSLAGLSGLAILITDAESRKRLVQAAIVVGPLVGVLLLASLVRWQLVLEDTKNLAILVALFTLGTLVRKRMASGVLYVVIATAAVCSALFLIRPEFFEPVLVDAFFFSWGHLTPGAVLATGFGIVIVATVAILVRYRLRYGLLGFLVTILVGLGLLVNRGRGAILWAFVGSVMALLMFLIPRLRQGASYERHVRFRSRIIFAVLLIIVIGSVAFFFGAPDTGSFRGLSDLRRTILSAVNATDAETDDSPLIWRIMSAGDSERQWRMQESVEEIRSAPLFGAGIGGYRALTSDYAHNVVLQVGVDGGFLAIAAFLWFVLFAVHTLFRVVTTSGHPVSAAALGGVLAAALIYQTSYNFYTAPILFISIGIALSAGVTTASEQALRNE